MLYSKWHVAQQHTSEEFSVVEDTTSSGFNEISATCFGQNPTEMYPLIYRNLVQKQMSFNGYNGYLS